GTKFLYNRFPFHLSVTSTQPLASIDVRDTRHFHTTNTEQEQRYSYPDCDQQPDFSGTPPPNKQEAVVRICHPNSFNLLYLNSCLFIIKKRWKCNDLLCPFKRQATPTPS
ncbi:hypothetical protein LEMLEM_LOCUS11049, partial [Lemmus lemmus]